MTDRERQVLTLLADGPSNLVIARRLGIAERTVKAHLTSLMRKRAFKRASKQPWSPTCTVKACLLEKCP
ncbi:response regulator transcription factor [Streptomyces chlorus]|uniref:Response regulator transcription factor n=1 Tax=Streptomyces chlorus TaxID=887452 RepID=A0ABW1DXA8_9ACTN